MTHRSFGMKFASVYPLYVQKAEKKGPTRDEVDDAICWLTGYDQSGLARQIEGGVDFTTFFAEARLHDHADKITGVVCGVRVENVEDPLMKKTASSTRSSTSSRRARLSTRSSGADVVVVERSARATSPPALLFSVFTALQRCEDLIPPASCPSE